MTDEQAARMTRGRLGWLLAGLALGALAVALYLGLTKLSGGNPVCGALQGCDTVNESEYAQIMGIPTALFGAVASAITLVGALGWWLRADRRALSVSYVVGLLSLPFLAWLTYLELFVIGAVCVWCVGYALLVIGGWATATWVLSRGAEEGV